jgi:hypothetical protein
MTAPVAFVETVNGYDIDCRLMVGLPTTGGARHQTALPVVVVVIVIVAVAVTVYCVLTVNPVHVPVDFVAVPPDGTGDIV